MNPLQLSLVETIQNFVATSPANRLVAIDRTPIFDKPLVGFAAGDDPLFEQYKEVIGAFHLTPREVLDQPTGDAPGVVVWVLPIPKKTRESNRAMLEGCSLRWNHTRFAGEDFNSLLRRHVVSFLQDQGIRAAAPVFSPAFRTVTLANGPASAWSERHAAYAAGLGTFSLSDGLITAKGIAHRIGSVVFAAPCEASPRPYVAHTEYCLYTRKGICGMCMRRCPAGAITAAGHDKLKCEAYLMQTLRPWADRPGYMGKTYVGCGLCQVGVPCESRIP